MLPLQEPSTKPEPEAKAETEVVWRIPPPVRPKPKQPKNIDHEVKEACCRYS